VAGLKGEDKLMVNGQLTIDAELDSALKIILKQACPGDRPGFRIGN
jgi:hypothetical protein